MKPIRVNRQLRRGSAAEGAVIFDVLENVLHRLVCEKRFP
jgi:hypothetical protein